jgi:pimeloyl-ACP methyl ester carboxylesterase
LYVLSIWEIPGSRSVRRDRIADLGYGQAYADAITGADFQVLRQTGHLPRLESPDLLLDAVRSFIDAVWSFSSTASSR